MFGFVPVRLNAANFFFFFVGVCVILIIVSDKNVCCRYHPWAYGRVRNPVALRHAVGADNCKYK